jgi:hypothetical protein
LVLTTYAPTISTGGQVWTVTFVGSQSCTGDLAATITTSALAINETTGELVANELAIV